MFPKPIISPTSAFPFGFLISIPATSLSFDGFRSISLTIPLPILPKPHTITRYILPPRFNFNKLPG